jgi:hypothetical protein
MSITRRIFFSLPYTTSRNGNEIGLSDLQRGLAEHLAFKVKSMGYAVEAFLSRGITVSPASAKSWTYQGVEELMRRCIGAVFVGMPRWIFKVPEAEWRLATEYSHFEAGMAVTLGLPRLVIVEEGLSHRAVFDPKHEFISWCPQEAGPAWLESGEFANALNGWKHGLDQHRDVFLGYSGKSSGLAKNVKLYLTSLGVTVLDWKTDFVPGGAVFDQIRETALRCSGGIFLFTKDDQMAGKRGVSAPRDNVVFEAGYFAAAKGKERVLIVREQGAKLLTDLGGDIYAALENPSDISSVEQDIVKFVEHRL